MAEKKNLKEKQQMLSLYLSNDIFQALRKFAFDKNKKYATYIRELLEKELKKAGYLKKIK